MATRSSNPNKEPGEQVVVITRAFDAPRELVWKAWTDCDRLMRWWGPKDFTTPLCKIDLRPGGVFHNCMRSAEGRDYCGKGVYREIVDPERIVFTDSFADKKGNIVPATYYGMSADYPLEMLVTVTFAEHKGKTKLTLKHALGSVPASERDLCHLGWSESLDKLTGELAKGLSSKKGKRDMATSKREGKMDTQAMMDVYTKLGTPGPPHKVLASMAGSWNTRIKSWTEPDKPPMESTGTCEQKVILGGRFLQQEFAGQMMGSPFTGIGVTGYDNHIKKYVSTWIDSMSTAILFFEGTAGVDGKTITQEACYDDPIRGPMKWRSVTRIVDDNAHLFEMYGTDKSGKEERMMEIIYTRKR